MVYDKCSISHKNKAPACLFLSMKARTYFEPLTCHIYLFVISSLFKVDLRLALRLRNTVELTHRTLLQNLSLKSLFSRPKDYVTMRNFLPPIWNKVKQPHTHLTATSVHSNKLTVTIKQFWGKNICEAKPTLWIKFDTKIKFWHTCRLLWLNTGARAEHLTNQLSWVAV